ncbi:aspartic peptidase domain-containing protein [Sphaerosporella brunnea]|uniref:Aspartic peptidase domain-containing protein n=1 Tax=Sphaerosporella brunnea TaxID=1250544 RepID=A0A5J5EVF9_9PEZI|nr:aspartic peptidase domain-containing protein [Sphaerosporella brunnea]
MSCCMAQYWRRMGEVGNYKDMATTASSRAAEVFASKMRENMRRSNILLLTSFAVLLSHCAAADPSAFLWLPGQTWDGNDGNWSTFVLRLDPEPHTEYVRVLPATDSSEIWAVSSRVCNSTLCRRERGGSFNITNSTSWEAQGPYQLDVTNNLFNYSDPKYGTPDGLAPRGDYGLATVGLTKNPTGVMLNHQVVAAIYANNFYNALFGLAINNTDFTGTGSYPSFLKSLFDNSLVPSLSWGYQAGAYWRNKFAASLCFGGYDSFRRSSTNATFPLSPTEGEQISAPLTSITLHTSRNAANTTLLSTPVKAFINSATPYLWLPLSTCKLLEAAFNITYNANSSLYLLSPWQHRYLQQLNPSLTFTLSSGSNNTATITVPFSALDLRIFLPLESLANRTSPQAYLPIKRATAESGVVLGRAFLQEAYLFVDYHRMHLQLAEARWPRDSGTVDVVSVAPPAPEPPVNVTVAAGGGGGKAKAVPGGITKAQRIAVATVGVVVGLLLITIVALLLLTRRRTGKWWPLDFSGSRTPDGKLNASTSAAEMEGDSKQPCEAGLGRERVEVDAECMLKSTGIGMAK